MDSPVQVDDTQTLRLFPLAHNGPKVTILASTRTQLIFVKCNPELDDGLQQNAADRSDLQLELGGWLPPGIRVSLP